MHDAPTDVLTDAYSGGRVRRRSRARDRRADQRSAGAPGRARRRPDCPGWMRRFGVAPPAVAARHAAPRPHQRVLSRRRQGADEQLLRGRRAPRASRVLYDAEVVGLDVADGRFRRRDRQPRPVARPPCAHGPSCSPSGGFESNLEWLKEIWGEAADNFIDPRHAVQHRGTVLKLMLDAGAQPVGDPHAVPRGGGRRPRAEVRRRHRHAPRLPCRSGSSSTRAASGSTTKARTSGRSATRSGAGSSRSSPIRSPTRSSTPRSSARSCRRCFRRWSRRLDSRAGVAARRCRPTRSMRTVDGVQPRRAARHLRSRGARRLPHRRPRRRTRRTGRRPLDTPPFWGYPLRPGITFTYLGLKVDERARVADDRRRARGQHLRGRRDHGRQHPRQGLRRRRRHDDRHGVRPDRRQRRRPRMLSDDLVRQGQHVMTVCNACRYCEGYCPVFPAMEDRLDVCEGRPRLPRQPLSQLRRVPLRVPVCAAARVRHQRAADAGGSPARVRTRSPAGRASLAGAFRRHSLANSWALAAGSSAVLIALAADVWRGHVAGAAGRRFLRRRPARRDGGALSAVRFALLALSIGFVGRCARSIRRCQRRLRRVQARRPARLSRAAARHSATR